MDWNEFAPLIHESWHEKLRKFIESEECDKIYKFLKKESMRGRKIAPLSSNVWRAFLETPYDELKVILCGMSPYHTLYQSKPIADGLLMSCSITGRLQPSLEKFYQGMENELSNGLNLHMIKTPNLSYLASQGVLMLNTSLTCEIMKPGSHNKLWEPFMKYLFEEVIITTGMPVVFLGKEAIRIERYMAPFSWIFKLNHPASAAYKSTEWNSEGVFTSINKILKGNNGIEINWYKTE